MAQGEPPTILALDLARTTGVALGRAGGAPVLQSISFSRSRDDDPGRIFGKALTWAATTFRLQRPDFVVIEAPISPSEMAGRTQFATTNLALGLRAIIQAVASLKGIHTRQVAIKTWRKYALHNGNLRGPDAKERAIKLCTDLGWQVPDHNAAEAGCIFLWAESQITPKLAQRPEPLFVGGSV
jgi:hypothetical protein